MSRIHPAWLAREQRRWLRPDAHRWWRPDHVRFDKPNGFERKYSSNQPRVPAGNPDGGQWTSGGSAARLLPGDLPTGAEALFEGGSQPEGPVQLAYLGQAFQAGRIAVQTGIEAALGLYAALSAQNGPDRSAVAVFRAMDFEAGTDALSPVSAVGRLTQDEVDQVCLRKGWFRT